MAKQEALCVISLDAGADLSAHQFKIVTIDSSGNAVLAGAASTWVGVLQNAPAAGETAEVAVPTGSGRMKVAASGALAIGAEVTSDAAGLAVAAGAGTSLVGVTVTAAGAAGDLVEVLAPAAKG